MQAKLNWAFSNLVALCCENNATNVNLNLFTGEDTKLLSFRTASRSYILFSVSWWIKPNLVNYRCMWGREVRSIDMKKRMVWEGINVHVVSIENIQRPDRSRSISLTFLIHPNTHTSIQRTWSPKKGREKRKMRTTLHNISIILLFFFHFLESPFIRLYLTRMYFG